MLRAVHEAMLKEGWVVSLAKDGYRLFFYPLAPALWLLSFCCLRENLQAFLPSFHQAKRQFGMFGRHSLKK